MKLKVKAMPAASSERRARQALRAVGRVTSINASLNMLVADARIAERFRGCGDDEDDNDSDWDRVGSC